METFVESSRMIAKNPVPGANGRIVHSPTMTVAHWSFDAGTVLPEHSHPHEQVALVVEGTLALTVNGVTRNLNAGDAAIIPGNVPHEARAVTACRIVDTFNPVREDLR